jgi:hypothetical protein
MALSPEAERQMAERRTAGQRWLAGEAVALVDQSRYQAQTIGLVADLEPGLEVWTWESGGRRDVHGDALGGIVLHVDTSTPKRVDDETGEVVGGVLIRCYDPLAPWPFRAFQVFQEGDLDPATIALMDPHELAKAIKRFCGEVARQIRGRRYSIGTFEAELVTDAWRLVVALMGRG